jgi:hypothetical protein
VWCVWSTEFIPALAAQFIERIAGRFNLLDGEWVDAAARWLPAEKPRKRPLPMVETSASAITLRAELPVQRNNTLYTLSVMTNPLITALVGGDSICTFGFMRHHRLRLAQ